MSRREYKHSQLSYQGGHLKYLKFTFFKNLEFISTFLSSLKFLNYRIFDLYQTLNEKSIHKIFKQIIQHLQVHQQTSKLILKIF